MDFSLNSKADILKNVDPSLLNEAKNTFENSSEDKTVNGVSVWDIETDEGYNKELMNRDGFVNALYDPDADNPYTKEELGLIYDVLSQLDGDESLSGDELEFLSYMHGNGHSISSEDIKVFLDTVEEAGYLTEHEQDCPECQNRENETMTAILKDDDRIKTDEDGAKYINVEHWQDPDSDEIPNNTLEHIIENCYDLEAMGIEKDSEEYYALEKAVMDANPHVYGTEEGGWQIGTEGTDRRNADLDDGDKIVLPDFEYEKEEPAPTVEPGAEPTNDTTPTVDTTPDEPTIDTTPTVDTTPDEPTIDTTPTVDTTPDEPTIDTTPTVDTTPDEPTIDTTPTVDTTPDEPTIDTTPTVDTTPDEPTIDTTPTVDTTPDEPTIDTTPTTMPTLEPTDGADDIPPVEPTTDPVEPSPTSEPTPSVEPDPTTSTTEPSPDQPTDSSPDIPEDTSCEENPFEDVIVEEEEPEL